GRTSGGNGFLSHLRSLAATMSQKSSVPQAAKFVSQALKRDSVHEFSHRPAECLKVFCAAMGFDRCLICVTLHEHIGIRHFTVVELIQQAALLVFVDLIDELSRDLLEFRGLALLDHDRCDSSKHFVSPSSLSLL